jgi:SNF2 family DNA or RNA helicase
MLEERGLLKPIGVAVHPQPGMLPAAMLDGSGLHMGFAFERAYEAAQEFCKLYAASRPAAGFMKTILLRRIGSSVKAGYNTADALLRKGEAAVENEETDDLPLETPVLSPAEQALLATVRNNLASLIDSSLPDPKAEAIIRYLRDHDWLSLGSVIFSQFFDTAEWIAEYIRDAFPAEPVAIYAGGGRSFVYRGRERRHAQREDIKRAVQGGVIRVLVATDTACEGLNLQHLGTQINVDLPWNPSRLEQRKGRVQRIGQVRDTIDVMNLRYAGTVEDDVYEVLSERFRDIFQVLGQLPDNFEEDWMEAIIQQREKVRYFVSRVKTERPPMERRYFKDVADDEGLDWEYCDRIIATHDIEAYMRNPW